MKRKAAIPRPNLGAHAYAELGPLSLVQLLTRHELAYLYCVRRDLEELGLGCKVSEYDQSPFCALDEQVAALEESRSKVLKWLERAIQIVPWPLQDCDGAFEIDCEKEMAAMKRERQEQMSLDKKDSAK